MGPNLVKKAVHLKVCEMVFFVCFIYILYGFLWKLVILSMV